MRTLENYAKQLMVGYIEEDEYYADNLLQWCRDADANNGVMPYDLQRTEAKIDGKTYAERKKFFSVEKALLLFEIVYESKYGLYLPKRVMEAALDFFKGKRIMVIECDPCPMEGFFARHGMQMLMFDSMSRENPIAAFKWDEVGATCGLLRTKMDPLDAIKKYGGDVEYVFYTYRQGKNILKDAISTLRDVNPWASIFYIGPDWFSVIRDDKFIGTIETIADPGIKNIQLAYADKNIYRRTDLSIEVIK